MPYPTIDPLPDVPNRSAEPEMFSDAVDSFLTALPTLQEQINDAGDYIETVGGQVDTDKLATAASASAASASASAALVSQNLAASSANYVGLWASLTGAKAVGICTFHIGSFWRLNVPLADVTTSTPSLTNTDWQFVSGTRWQAVQTSAFTAAKNALYPVTATSATLDVTLPAFTAGDFFVIANNPTSTQLMRIVKSGVTVTNSLGVVVASGDNITYRAGQIFRAYAISSTALVVY
jgi:hypothetical protein